MSYNVHPFPVAPQERFLSRKELAEIMGISVRTVDQFIAEGCPCERWGRRARRLLLSEVLAWARERGKDAAA